MMPDHTYLHESTTDSEVSQGSISHAVRILRSYRSAIVAALLGIILGYSIIVCAMYLAAGRQEVTSQPFRLDFNGATTGHYPNGMKFSSSEIINTPTLIEVFNRNEISRFAPFPEFAKSVYVLESNRALELLAAEYQAKLADPKLNPVDRERIQREFEMKREALSKAEFAINFQRNSKTAKIPNAVVKKALLDVLGSWARRAINEQHVLSYRVPILSPSILNQSQGSSSEPLITAHVLRSRIVRVLENVASLNDLPAADLARTRRDNLSLAEIKLRLEEIIRFRLDPLVSTIVNGGHADARAEQFVQDQLAFDQRQLQAARDRAATFRESLAVYANGTVKPGGTETAQARVQPAGRTGDTAAGETVMPQLSENFLDRIVAMANNAADAEYRQKLIGDYRNASEQIIPIEEAVAYNGAVLQQLRSRRGSTPESTEAINAETAAIRADVEELVKAVNEIYLEVSANLNASTELYSLTGPSTRGIDRSFSFTSAAAIGVLVFLLSIPIILAACLIHSGVRREDDAEIADQLTTPHRDAVSVR